MKNIFSLKLYLEGLKKVKLLGVAVSIIIIVANALFPILTWFSISRTYDYDSTQVVIKSLMQHIPVGIVMIGFAVLFVHNMFSYLNDRCRSDFYHALPQKRICVFISFGAAILTWMLGILLVSSALNLLLWNIIPGYAVSLGVAVAAPLIYFAAAFLVGGFMAVAMMLTGTDMNNFLIFILGFLFVRIVGGTFLSCAEQLIPVFYAGASVFRFLKWEYFLPISLFASLIDNDISLLVTPGVIAYGVGLGAVLWVAAGWLYQIRRSETAGKSAPNRLLQNIYRCAVSLPFFLWGVFWAIDKSYSAAITFWVIGLIVYFIYELMTTKKLKNLAKAIPVLVVPVVCCFIFLGGNFLLKSVYNSVRPAAEDIDSVAICRESDDAFAYSSSGTRVTSEIFVSNENIAKLVAENLGRTIDENFGKGEYTISEHFAIKLKSGRVIYRRICFSGLEYDEMWKIYSRSEEYMAGLIEIPQENTVQVVTMDLPIALENEEAKKVYRVFYEEYSLLTSAQKMDIIEKNYGEGVYQIYVYGTKNLGSYSTSYNIDKESLPKTFRYITALFFEKQSTADFDQMCRFLADNPEMAENEKIYVSLRINSICGQETDVDIYRDKTFASKMQTLTELLKSGGKDADAATILHISGYYTDEGIYYDKYYESYYAYEDEIKRKQNDFTFDFIVSVDQTLFDSIVKLFEKE